MMFALHPVAPDVGDLQPLSDAIDALCDVLDGEREALIEGLAEIVRQRTAFERCKQAFEDRDHFV